ncbi:MAG: transporter [Pseudomonadota bacterium]
MKNAVVLSVTLVASMLPGGCLSALADEAEPPINTERPSFSASPVALMTGAIQIETGYQYTDDSASIDTFPNLLLRYGFDEFWEIQFGWAGENRVDLGSSTIRGATDVSIGVKRSLDIHSDATALALLATVSLPTGNRAFSSDSVDPSVGLLWSHETNLSWFGTALVGESDGDIVLSNGIGLSFSVASKTGAYLEFVTQVPEGRGPAHTLNGGLSFTPQNNIQWDVYGGTGLNDRAADWFVGAGFAIRL